MASGIDIKIRADGRAASREIRKVGASVRDMGADAERTGRRAARMFGGFVITAGDVQRAVSAAGRAIAGVVTNTAAMGDETAKIARVVNISANELQSLQFAAGRSNTDISALNNGIKRLQRNMLDSVTGNRRMAEMFKRLGIEVVGADGGLRDVMGVFRDLSDALLPFEGRAEGVGVRMLLLGRAGAELGNLMAGGSAGIAAMGDTLDRLQGRMSAGLLQSSENYQDSILDMNTAFQGVRNTLTEALLPSLISLNRSITDFVTSHGPAMVQGLIEIGRMAARSAEEVLTLIRAASGEDVSGGPTQSERAAEAAIGRMVDRVDAIKALRAQFDAVNAMPDLRFGPSIEKGRAEQGLLQAAEALGLVEEIGQDISSLSTDKRRGLLGALGADTLNAELAEAQSRLDKMIKAVGGEIGMGPAAGSGGPKPDPPKLPGLGDPSEEEEVAARRRAAAEEEIRRIQRELQVFTASEEEKIRLRAQFAAEDIERRLAAEEINEAEAKTLKTLNEQLLMVGLIRESERQRADAARKEAEQRRQRAEEQREFQRLEQEHHAEMRRLDEERAANRVATVRASVDATTGLLGAGADVADLIYRRESDSNKKAARKAFEVRKAFSLAQAAVNIALGVTNAFATAPNFIAGALAAVAVGVAGGVSVARIAAEQPAFGDAGIMPGSLGSLRDTHRSVIVRNDEMVVDPTGTKHISAMFGMMRRNTELGAQSRPANVHANLYLDGEIAAQSVERVFIDRAEGGRDWRDMVRA